MSAAVRLDTSDLQAYARGCGILGTGGGGAFRFGLMAAQQAVLRYGPIDVVSLDDLPDDGLLMPCGQVGAPTVSLEKLGSGDEGQHLRGRLEQATRQRVVAVLCAEIGGSNGLIPAAWAAQLGLPLADADGMGRAFPKISMSSLNLYGISPGPAVLADEHGNATVAYPRDAAWLERIMRAAVVVFGGQGAGCVYPLSVAEARRAAIPGSVSRALRIGLALQAAADPVSDLVTALGGVRLLGGKVVDVERRTADGFSRGSATIEGLAHDHGRLLRIEIQNENLAALEDGRLVASVPDLITVVDTGTGDAVSTELLRYGQRVTAIASPCAAVWRTGAGLDLVGPAVFGYDFGYEPLESLHANA
ncbi:MAG TPA: DUF917 domain-containing protein [Streptosporangiaceae bacterium]|jgi:hypothetical protein